MDKEEFKTLTKRTKAMLDREEDCDLEFKQSVKLLDDSDIAAFANSEKGGTILIGVREKQVGKGRRIGKIIGCPIGDTERRKILEKAERCIPPVDIKVFVENTKYMPIFRVKIESGNNKPYATAGGVYKVRGKGRNYALVPRRLLALFLENESNSFFDKFKVAAEDLEQKLKIISGKTDELMSNFESSSDRIESSLDDIFNKAEDATSLSGDAMGFSDETLGIVRETEDDIKMIPSLYSRLDALLKYFDIESPELTQRKNVIKDFIKAMIRSPLRGFKSDKKSILKLLKFVWKKMEKKELELIYEEARKELKDKTLISVIKP